MDNRWTHSWEEYYTREFCSSVAYAQRPLENDPELAKLAESFIKIVIPRLLRPLQTGGYIISSPLFALVIFGMQIFKQMPSRTKQFFSTLVALWTP
jgi:hypothetical protein